VKISKTLAGVATAAALAGLLTACTSASNSAGDNAAPAPSRLSVPSSTSASVSARPSTVARIVSPKPSTGGGSTPAPRPVPTRPAAAHSSTPSASASHPTPASPPAPPTLSGPVTFSSVAFQSPYNCAESGTGYYTAPNITAAVDVTVLVNSPALARDLVIAAPNRAPRGLSNASQWISATSLGGNVWRATYRTFVALTGPKYTPVTVSSLQASANGTPYTITFSSPLSVTLADCHS
jgi:hypothetical protein